MASFTYVGQQYVSQARQELVLKEYVSAVRGDHFDIYDSSGTAVFRCDAKLFSFITDKRVIVDGATNGARGLIFLVVPLLPQKRKKETLLL